MSNPRGDTVVRWIVAMGVVDTLAVMLRLLIRKKNGTKIAADDWMIMASLVPAYCMIVTASLCVTKGGLGKHIAELLASELTIFLKGVIPAMISYGLTITGVKISILLLYRRVFGTVATFKKASLVVGFLCIAWLCGNVFTEVFLCSPMSAAWDPSLLFSTHCSDIQAFLLGITISNLLLDVIILCMPLPMIWDLQLTTRRKFEVSGVFLLGSFSCISSLVRILSIGNIRDEDFSYTFLNPFLWSHVEPATAIWCACLMTYGPLFAEVGPELRGFFGGRKERLFTKKKFLGIKLINTNSTGSDSSTLTSLGTNILGRGSAGYRDLSYRTAEENLDVLDVFAASIPLDRRFSPAVDECLCSKIVMGRNSSLV
ncbi:hypothetical protein MMC07_003937 [Pseudocyphellaria aurata]|nr:hypothetical protein [Pseudocyphellaria aurata]